MHMSIAGYNEVSYSSLLHRCIYASVASRRRRMVERTVTAAAVLQHGK